MKEEIEQLKREIAELQKWKEDKERQQLSLPLDPASLQILSQALISGQIDKVILKSLFLKTNASDEPLVDGQIVYKKSTETLKVMLGGVLKTITTA